MYVFEVVFSLNEVYLDTCQSEDDSLCLFSLNTGQLCGYVQVRASGEEDIEQPETVASNAGPRKRVNTTSNNINSKVKF